MAVTIGDKNCTAENENGERSPRGSGCRSRTRESVSCIRQNTGRLPPSCRRAIAVLDIVRPRCNIRSRPDRGHLGKRTFEQSVVG